MQPFNRRTLLKRMGAVGAAVVAPGLKTWGNAAADDRSTDSLPMQLYKSLNDQQREAICLPADHPRRGFVSNWWYIHRDHRINNAFNSDQQNLIQQIFDSLHNPAYRNAVNEQVKIDQYGAAKNSPAVGFFGTPDQDDFEFLFTGHHVTRRCCAHSDKGLGFGGNPIFYGHFRDEFNETSEHLGNPYWYQGKIFNRFVSSLDREQQAAGLIQGRPRSERDNEVIRKRTEGWPGLSCSYLDDQQKSLFVQTMREMLTMFRADDVNVTIKSIVDRNMVDQLYVSWYDGKYDVGSDRVWDTWQIEGPEMVWYFRGQPHIHSYFHLRS